MSKLSSQSLLNEMITVYIFQILYSPCPFNQIIMNDISHNYQYKSFISLMLLLKSFTEWTWIRLSPKEVDYSTHQLVPFFLVILPKIFPDFVYMGIYAFNSAVNIAFFRISNRPKLMFLLNYFGEIPKLRWPPHVFCFEGVVDCLHVFECFSCTFQLLVLTLSSRKHAFSND